jgi:hypothetical protein
MASLREKKPIPANPWIGFMSGWVSAAGMPATTLRFNGVNSYASVANNAALNV